MAVSHPSDERVEREARGGIETRHRKPARAPRAQLGFESRILGRHVARAYVLESLVICSFLRGLSVRDVEAALAETFDEPVIGKSTVARVCQDTRERYRRWCERRRGGPFPGD